ncbi:caspase recruitment domain-containing protein 11-like [Amblyraja radiata]|uniref:caspase recruitment domain-containing protein 11-like n=1 Tax=Amblyraja radiata TaxID=386614 RepID=UPI001403428A|nr:caspase recruitment domain-containing protein 11-like [Amblyraja radiata]
MDEIASSVMEVKDLDEETIWDLIESQRHIITNSVRPCHITPFLRQCHVIGETDEEEILFAPHLKHRCMRTGYMLDLLRTRGKKGGVAFLESLGFYNPEIYTSITGKEPTKDCSSILDEKGNLSLIQSLMNEVMNAQKWLGEEKCIKHRLNEKMQGMEEQNQQLKTELTNLKAAEVNLSRMKMDWNRHHDEMIRLKEENYQILMRYTNTLQEKEMSVTRSRELRQQVDNLIMENKKLIVEFDVERRVSSKLREAFKPKQDELLHLKEEIDKLRFRIQEVQMNPVTIDILEQDRVEALEESQDLMKVMNSLRLELDKAERLRNEYLDEKENMFMECATLKIDCDMYKDKISSLQSQVLELQKERDEAYGARDEAQMHISKTITDKDLCRRQVIELQDTCRQLNKEMLQFKSSKERQEDGGSCVAQSVSASQVGEMSQTKPVSLSRDQLVTEQKCDADLSALIDRAVSEVEVDSLSKGYFLRDNLLMRKWSPLNASGQDDWSVVKQIVVPHRSWIDHIDHLTEVFKRLAHANLTINLGKCEFGQATVTTPCYLAAPDLIGGSWPKLHHVNLMTEPQLKKTM